MERARRLPAVLAVTILVTALVAPAAASAATTNSLVVGGLLDKIAEVVFDAGGFTVKTAGGFLLNLLGGLADMLVPDDWARRGSGFMIWLSAVPDYTNRAFHDIHDLRRINVFIAAVFLPITLTWAGLRASAGASEPIAPAVLRTVVVATALVLWAQLWRQGAAVTNQLTNTYLSQPAVVAGINDYMEIVASGAGLGLLPFLGVAIMIVAGFLFLAILALKVAVILIGAVLYAFGPLLLAVAPYSGGSRLLHRYAGLVWSIFALPVGISAIYAVSAILIHSAGPIGTTLGGADSIFRSLTATVITGFAAILGPLFCIGLARRAFAPALQTLGQVSAQARPSAMAERGVAALRAAKDGKLGAGTPVRAIGGGPPKGGSVGALARLSESRQHSEARRLMRAGARQEFSQASPARRALMAAQIAAGGGLVGAATLGAGMAKDSFKGSDHARARRAIATAGAAGALAGQPAAPAVAAPPPSVRPAPGVQNVEQRAAGDRGQGAAIPPADRPNSSPGPHAPSSDVTRPGAPSSLAAREAQHHSSTSQQNAAPARSAPSAPDGKPGPDGAPGRDPRPSSAPPARPDRARDDDRRPVSKRASTDRDEPRSVDPIRPEGDR